MRNRSSLFGNSSRVVRSFQTNTKYANRLLPLESARDFDEEPEEIRRSREVVFGGKVYSATARERLPRYLAYREELGETLLNFGFLLELLKRRPEAEATHRAALAEFTYVANRQQRR